MNEYLVSRGSQRWLQMAVNRCPDVYFLRELNKVDAALVFVYFVGDTTVSGRDPVSHQGWQTAIGLATHHLGMQ